MKLTKTVTSLLLASILLLGLAACGDRQPAGEPNEFGFRPVRITYASVQGREGWNYNTGDDFGRFLSERFNYELEFTALNLDTWAQRMNIWISSQDMPDVAVYDYVHANAASYVEQELIFRFPDNWQQRWPNAAAIYNLTQLGPKLDEIFGGTYFFPRARFADNLPGIPVPNHHSIHMRKDWMRAVGMEVKGYHTIQEVMEFARRVRDRDPGNVGSGLIPITGTPSNLARMFLQSNSTHYDTFYRDPADGIYKWGPADPRTLEGLRLWYEAYSTGLIDPEFFLLTSGQDQDKFELTLRAASIFNEGTTTDVRRRRINFQNNTGLNGDDHVHMATLLGTDGLHHQRDLINYWGTIIFRPDVNIEVFERWMSLMDYRSTRVGYISSLLGLQGIDWDFGPDGVSLISLVPEGVTLSGAPGVGKYSSMGYILGSTLLFDDLNFDNPNIDEHHRRESWELYMSRIQHSTPQSFPIVDWDLFTYDSPNRRRVSYNFPVEFSNMITTATSMANLEQIYWNWINAQRNIVQPVLDELNARR